jgi:hypothetical protein
MQLRKKRNKSKKEPMAFLNWRFGLARMTAWRIEVAPFPDLSNVAPHKSYHHHRHLYI